MPNVVAMTLNTASVGPGNYGILDHPVIESSNNEIGGIAMQKWECQVCGYIYDPEVGDPDNGINPATAFEDLPDDWVCPQCGAPKSDFEKV